MNGHAVAVAILRNVADRVRTMTQGGSRPPTLATLLVGDDPASGVYVASKHAKAKQVGIASVECTLSASASDAEIRTEVKRLAADRHVDGILVQLPLPGHRDPSDVIDAIPWQKDVDGLTTTSTGLLHRGRPGLRPCTPAGIIALLDAYDVALEGADVVVVGRSGLVGRPIAQMLTQRDATTTIVHSRTANSVDIMRRAEILIVAAGFPGLIGRESVRAGAVVVDVGIHRTAGGLCGDVRTDELMGHAAAVTPVPGGVGPMTIASLMRSVVEAAALGAAVP